MRNIRVIPFARPWIEEEDRQAVLKVLQGTTLTHGPEVRSFEKEFGEFLGGEGCCVAVSSCMGALHLAYLSLGIGQGDEVIVPAMTHAATAHAVELVGAKPIFADCDLQTGNINVNLLESLMTPRTKALSLVHFVGIPCQMEQILAIANRYRLKVIEDCALALGTRYQGKHVGLFGDAGCFSFYPAKHITTGEGGMFVTKHKEIADLVSKLRAFGTDRAPHARAIPGLYDVPALGLNYRMSEMAAALGRRQVQRIGDNLERRRQNFDRIRALLSGIREMTILEPVSEESRSSYYCLSLLLNGTLKEKRNSLILQLNGAGVGTSIYYPHPVPRLTYYREKYGYEASYFPNASAISDHSIALPVGPHLKRRDVERIGKTLQDVLGRKSV